MAQDDDVAVRVARGDALRRCWTNVRLRRILAAYVLFNVAEWASWIALLVWAYTAGGVRGAGALALAQLLPAVVVAPVLAGRLSRLRGPRALLVGYAAQALTALGLGAAILLDAPVVVVGIGAALYNCAITGTRPVHYALLPEVSRTTDELTAGNAGSGWAEAAATFLGPVAASAVMVHWGPGAVVVAMGAAAWISTALAAAIGPGAPRLPDDADDTGLDALRLVMADPAARMLTGLVAAEYVLIGMLDILLVVLALDVLGLSDSGPGWLNSSIGVGGLVGAAATVVLVGARRLSHHVVVGAVVCGAAFAVAGLVDGVVAALVALAVCGAGKSFFDVALRSFVQRLLPDSQLTAVFGVQEATMMAGLAVGSLATPVLVELVGAAATFVVAGCFLPAVALLVWRALRRLDDAAAVPAGTLALLGGVPMLAVLAPRVLERLAVFSRQAEHADGTAIVTEGEHGGLFYVLTSGQVVVSHGDDVIRTLGPGDWFGELALLDARARRTATVTAAGAVRLVTLDRSTFLTALLGTASSRGLAEEHARLHYR